MRENRSKKFSLVLFTTMKAMVFQGMNPNSYCFDSLVIT